MTYDVKCLRWFSAGSTELDAAVPARCIGVLPLRTVVEPVSRATGKMASYPCDRISHFRHDLRPQFFNKRVKQNA